jgi:hypothetical protein
MEIAISKTQLSLAFEEAKRATSERDQNLAELERLRELEKGLEEAGNRASERDSRLAAEIETLKFQAYQIAEAAELAKKESRQRLVEQKRLQDAEADRVILQTHLFMVNERAEQVSMERDQNLTELKRLQEQEKWYKEAQQAKAPNDAEVAERIASMKYQVSLAMKDTEEARAKRNQVLEEFERLKEAEINHKLEMAALKIQLDTLKRDADSESNLQLVNLDDTGEAVRL